MLAPSKLWAANGRISPVLILLAIACPTWADPAGRPVKQIQADIQAIDTDIHRNANFDPSVKYSLQARQQMLSQIAPLYQKEADLYTELAAAVPKVKAAALHEVSVDEARIAFWGDADAKAKVDALASDADKTTSLDGKADQQLIAWWNAFGNADAQNAVIDSLDGLAKTWPTSNFLADDIQLMLETNPATVAVGQRLTTVLCVKLAKTSIAAAYAARPNRIDEPFDFEGTTLKGDTFKLKKLRGKVVLVDFWATWCPPCREELPHTAEVYKTYHDQGFEIIGVSSDNDRSQLANFLKDHPEMPWQELFHAGNGWHPLTKLFKINSIPTMYLVDRNGNLRMMTDRSEHFKDLLPKLLAEPYTPPTQSKPAAKAAGKPISPAPIGN